MTTLQIEKIQCEEPNCTTGASTRVWRKTLDPNYKWSDATLVGIFCEEHAHRQKVIKDNH